MPGSALTPSPDTAQLLIEIQRGESFVKIDRTITKCMIRVTFRGTQKKTKKNVNLTDPKFYEMLKFSVWQSGTDGRNPMNVHLDDQITI